MATKPQTPPPPNLAALGKEYLRLRAQKDDLAASEKVLNEEVRAVEDQLKAALEAQGIEKFSVDGATIFVQDDMSHKVTDEPKLLAWLRETGNEAVVKQTVNYQTLRSLCRTWLEEHGMLPDGIEATMFKRIALRRGNAR